MSDLLEVLRQAVAQQGQAAVAKTLGYSRSTISLLLAGKYSGRADLVLEKVKATLGNVTCMYTGEVITLTACKTIASSPAPTHNRVKMAHWHTCQQCPINCKGE
ncbi:XRE family transcriptional regulator [uncultured Aquitalea sp.]|uniref:XRE family transcriptional regulator n=1 Tax=uncultured Aquitalea sp. TaxID=540272 RepID=UPI0025E37CDC|nr:XRE family transcriptional regulator [uncultured Aquitalea sp.]